MSEISDISRWNEIAWNGIAFRKPSCWEPVTLGRNYLMLGTRTGPRMEITWGDSSRRAWHHRSLKKLQVKIGEKQGLPVDVWMPPQIWLDALPTHKVNGFSWKNPAGVALIVSCTSCNRTSLLQFHQVSREDPGCFNTAVAKVLSTFRDHSEDSSLQWSVFDVRATLPTAFRIKSYQFSPGFMTMDFFTTGMNISLYRWSPASVLLGGRKLSEFAGSLPFYSSSSTSEILNEPDRMEWKKSPPFGLKSRIAAFLFAEYAHQRFHIRHNPVTNRILAVRLESRQPVDSHLFEQIVAHYEISAP